MTKYTAEELQKALKQNAQNPIYKPYNQLCLDISNHKTYTGYFKLWTKSLKNPGLTLQRNGNVLLTFEAYEQEQGIAPSYFVRQPGPLQTYPSEKEILPIGTTFNAFLTDSQKDLLDSLFKLEGVSTLLIKIDNIPLFLEGIVLTLQERDANGNLLHNGSNYSAFSIRLPKVEFGLDNIWNYTIQNDNITLPLIEVQSPTEKYLMIQEMNISASERGNKASNEYGARSYRSTPRGYQQNDFNELSDRGPNYEAVSSASTVEL